jgi:signal transduction histidine kinase
MRTNLHGLLAPMLHNWTAYCKYIFRQLICTGRISSCTAQHHSLHDYKSFTFRHNCVSISFYRFTDYLMILSPRSGRGRTFLSYILVTLACILPLITITFIYSTYVLPDTCKSNTISMNGIWMIREGAEPGLDTGTIDITKWKRITLPGNFHSQGYPGTRYTIRRDVTLLDGMEERELFFMIGGTLGSVGTVYFNGQKIGTIGININGTPSQGTDDKYGFTIGKELIHGLAATIAIDFTQLTPGYGGVQDPRLYLGRADSLQSYFDLNKNVASFFQQGIILAGLFVLGIIFVLLLNEWDTEERHKYFSTILFVSTVIFYNFCFSGVFLKHLVSFAFLVKLLKISIVFICIGSLEFIQFFHLHKTNFITKANRVICVCFIFFFLFTDNFVTIQRIYFVFIFYFFIAIFYFCTLSIVCTIQNRSRYGLIISVSIVTATFTGICDFLTNLGVLHLPLLFNSTISVYIVLSAMMIIIQFISINNAKKKLTQQLLQLNETLETQVKTRTRELRYANKKLKNLDARKNDFIMNITHDFRSPLTAILNSAELELKSNSSSNRKSLEVIQDAASRIDHTINRLLDLAKLDSRGIRINREEIDLIPLITRIIDFYKAAAESTGQKIINNLPARINGSFYSDSDRLDQILNNIISNAVKFSDPQSGVITIDCIDARDRVIIIVTDNGIGIPRGKLRAIFNRFEQIRNDTNLTRRGTGIGLAFAKELTRLLNGKIWAESKGENTGSRFFASFPKGTRRP